MDYREARQYIDQIQVDLGSEYSLREVSKLANDMGNPERDCRIIHIAGTNGKGSVGNFLANILACAGYTVGRYVSPAVTCYRERIQRVSLDSHTGQVITEWITEEEVAGVLSEMKPLCEEMQRQGYHHPTAFEIETVMAFRTFCEWRVDFVLLECGMGGRLDATNYIESPLLCLFTSISRDHMAVLGNSVIQIAKEKYGIIKDQTIVVSAKQEECDELLTDVCEDQHASLHFVCENKGEAYRIHSVDDTEFAYRDERYHLSQPGLYQIENAKLALEAAIQLQASGTAEIPVSAMQDGIRVSKWRGRFEVLKKKPFILMDGAHNIDAVDRLCESLQAYFPQEKFQFIMGVFKDKEYASMIARILPYAKVIYAITAPGPRGLDSKKLAEECYRQADIQGITITDGSVLKVGQEQQQQDILLYVGMTMQDALQHAQKTEDKTIVFGSLSIQRDCLSAMA